jgi:N6-adenosine-specific RNA methylase IME4
MSGRYRTIVADPPWEIGAFPEWGSGRGTIPTPYPTMTLDAIKALPVGSVAAPEAHLYLWTTVEFLRDAYDVAGAWGFEPMYPLHWCKPPRGNGLGGKFACGRDHHEGGQCRDGHLGYGGLVAFSHPASLAHPYVGAMAPTQGADRVRRRARR